MESLVNDDLVTEEIIVLNVVKEYLNKNRQFNIIEIVPFINARFKRSSININDQGIKDILKSLVKKSFLVEGSRLTRDKILENEKRKHIYEYILENSGCYFNKIMDELKFNNYLVVWHVDLLEKFKFIKKEQFDNRYIYYDINMDVEQVKTLYFASKKKSKLIFSYIQQNNIGITKTQIANDLKMHMNTVQKYLEILESISLISKEKIDNQFLYFIK